ncbi:nicotinate-nucleotide--dimethylbenzimidazole phosphoribosyltransferase [Alicyclobacillaceae bacterium I2511]|nr:nicotinate-nucleotide--dimethylbenzimidazole phosphoribosyltransferase [Alicyclobacillaceae bacterium I2511]
MKILETTLQQINDLDKKSMDAARLRLNQLTKPLGSLGILEELAERLAGIYGNPYPTIGDKVVILMAGDHGVVDEGVTAFPQEVTAQMVLNFISGGAGINVLARHAGARVVVVDVGIAQPLEHPILVQRSIRRGTWNLAQGPAMTREEAIAAVEAGIEVATTEIARGATLLATGDMGIGNTTPSSAILAVISGYPVEKLVGRGTGINDERLAHKIQVIQSAIALNHPIPQDALDVLAKVGGFEIGGLAGVVLAAAAHQIPVIIDGFISTTAALIASHLHPKSTQYMIASHVSKEPGHRILLDLLGLHPMLQLNMRLGEGTGAALAMNIVEAATKILREMATFSDVGISEVNTHSES